MNPNFISLQEFPGKGIEIGVSAIRADPALFCGKELLALLILFLANTNQEVGDCCLFSSPP